jgi:hypothetical protein
LSDSMTSEEQESNDCNPRLGVWILGMQFRACLDAALHILATSGM